MTSPRQAFERRFAEYVRNLIAVIGHVDRHAPLKSYLTGLTLPGDRKSVEPMAARVQPHRAGPCQQSMNHFVANAAWDDAAVIRVARNWVIDAMERHGPVAAWIVDDTSFPKKGHHSVGVTRQYCGALGKQENCQVAVSVSLANEVVSVPAGFRLYLPEVWVKDRKRRKEAGIPPLLGFRTKGEIAVGLIDGLIDNELPVAPVVADAGYGVSTQFRDDLTRRNVPYLLGITGETTVWPPGQEPLPPKQTRGSGRPQTRLQRPRGQRPISVHILAANLPRNAWKLVTWREGSRGAMRSRFAWLRVRPAHRDNRRSTPRPVEWLLVEWPPDENAPTQFWLSTLPADTPGRDLVWLAMIRWRIERDYQELKDEIGLDQFEGRGWRGFHHHGSLCIATYAFLAAERARLSPPAALSFLEVPPVPQGFRPRGSPGPRRKT